MLKQMSLSVAVVVALTFSVGTKVFALVPTHLRTEAKVDPIGIGESQPMFSWIETAENGARGQSQSAYRVTVAGSDAALASGNNLLWDSGKVTSDDTLGIAYNGKPLTSGQRAVWAVQVWDQDGNPSAQSASATFEIGLLKQTDWQGNWISSSAKRATTQAIVSVAPKKSSSTQAATINATTQPTTRIANQPTFNVPLFLRKPITIDKPVKSARLYVSALGLYVASIDGNRIGDAILAPGWTDYRKRVRYQTFDVTAALTQGKHVLGATIADGWYSGHLPVVGYHHYGDRPALREQLVINYSDGSTQTIATDSSWKTSVGPILRSDIFDGEDFDAREELTGWNRPDYDDRAWVAAAEQKLTPDLDAQVGPLVRELMTISPKTMTEPKPGLYTFDLEQNMVGYVRLMASAPRGTKVTLRFAEMLNPDGTVYTDNLRKARATDTYIFKGDGVETYAPSFTFHGFRYVELAGLPSRPSMDAIQGIVIGSDNRQTGQWTSSSKILNQLQSNIVWGQRGNYISIPTDCPQRDERLGWLGDAQVFVRTATFNSDVQNFFNSWLVDVSDAQMPDGAYTDVAPNILKGSGASAWADAGVICPWTIYQVYGDKRLLQRQYDSMVRYMGYLQKQNENFIRPNKGYGDWLSIKANTPKDLLATAYFAYSSKLMGEIATALGKADDAAKYTQLYDQVREAFRKKWVGPDGAVLGNTQTSYLLALKMGLLDPSERPAAVKRLVADIQQKDNHLSTGFVGVSYLLPMLSESGQTTVAYTLLNQDTFPSWLFSVKQGATTIWERWDGWTPDKGFQTTVMNSFNHYSLGSCGEWMYDTVAGLGMDRSVPGFKKIVFRPTPGGGLTSASATYDSVRGPVACKWAIDDSGLHVNVSVPPNTTATLYLPEPYSGTLTESDKPVADAKGVKEISNSATDRAVALESGNYQFTALAK